MLQWISTKCWPLIGRFFSGHYVCNHSSYCFHIEAVNSPEWPSDLIGIVSCSSEFLPNAGLWLVDSFLAIIYATIRHIDFILELWTYLSVSHTWLTYHHAPVIFHWMLASGQFISCHYLHIHSSYRFHIGTGNSPKWPSDLIGVL